MSITRFAGQGGLRFGDGKLPWWMAVVGSAVMAAGFVFTTSVQTAGAVGPPAGAIVVGQIAGPECPSPITTAIQPVIDAAAPNAVIYICAGTYNEQLTINKPLTLLGAQRGVDARTGRTNPAAETVFDVPAGAIVYTTGATTGTLDGFTLRNADGVAINGVGNGTAQSYTFQNNIITANAVGIDFHTSGPAVSLISRNRFVENNKNPGVNPNSGSSIFLTSGTTNGLMIEDNRFQGNVGNSAADINTPGLEGALDTGIIIRNNTSIDDVTFAVINDTSGTQVLNNTITHSDPAAPSGTAILLFSSNPGVVISGNTINGGTGRGVGDFSDPSGNPTITGNSISNRGVGVRLSQVGATVSGNTITNSTQFGIQMQPTSSGGTITGNTISSTTGIDCRDESLGSGTAGTANTWTSNIGLTSSPAGLCAPPPPTTTTTTTTTIPVTTTTSPTPAPGVTSTLPAILPPTPGPGILPATGRNSTGPLIALGLGLIVVGLTLTRVRRRA